MHDVVVIEDEPDIAMLVTTKFRNAGYRVHVAGDGEQGLALVKEVAPAVVLLDVMMPRRDGYEVCAAIRDHYGATPPPIVVLLSARSQAADRQRGFDAGCDDYLTKPFRPSELLERVTQLLERQTGS